MAIKLANGKYQCLFCNFTSTNSVEVDGHRDREHNYVLVPMLKEDLIRLMQFIYKNSSYDDGLITERLFATLKSYANSRKAENITYSTNTEEE